MSAWMEGKLIIPAGPEQGSRLRVQPYKLELAKLERLLVAAFGGYTMTEGEGAWRPDKRAVVRERVRVYLFAFDRHDQLTAEVVDRLPADLCVTFDQDAIYLSQTSKEGNPIHG